MKTLIPLSVTLLSIVLSGCGIGYNQALFATTSNVGINIDTKPPTAEISIARREGVIAPTFEGGQHPPVYASFGLEAGGFLPFTSSVSGLFAGGHAAAIVSNQGPGPGASDVICLSELPKDTTFGNAAFGPGDVQPMYFGTDSSFGLKLGWSGTAGPYPDSV